MSPRLTKLALLLASTFLALSACSKKEEAAPAPSSAAPAATTETAPTVVLIGHVAPLTGGIAHLGKDNENGARLAVEEINKAGLEIGGKKIKLELVAEDDAADPKQGTTVAEKLVDEKVVAVVGHLNSGVSIPASTIYARAGIPQISPSSTNPNYTLKADKTEKGMVATYRTIATDAQQGPAIANYAIKTMGAKSIAVIDDATEYGKGLADIVEKVAKEAGINVVAHEATTNTAKDFKAILTKLKATKPDVIMFGGMDDVAAPMARQMKELGMKMHLMGGDGACTDKFIELAGDASEALICTEAGLPLSKMPKGEEFRAHYKERFNSEVQVYGPFAYDAVYVLVDAMKRAGSTEPEKIIAALPQTKTDGVSGTVEFDEKGDLKNGAITVYEIKAGKKEVAEIVK
ncbi:branched-chain amino acid ABC transporter substrate-binding protein [Ampullimonas aquatilis]|uniref:branched-chain amino acid ABC transporter substrate-binding protein n=1 Tax=Ampullimonas aquatilis TaxID=1341549 RepID=UPI003C7888DF